MDFQYPPAERFCNQHTICRVQQQAVCKCKPRRHNLDRLALLFHQHSSSWSAVKNGSNYVAPVIVWVRIRKDQRVSVSLHHCVDEIDPSRNVVRQNDRIQRCQLSSFPIQLTCTNAKHPRIGFANQQITFVIKRNSERSSAIDFSRIFVLVAECRAQHSSRSSNEPGFVGSSVHPCNRSYMQNQKGREMGNDSFDFSFFKTCHEWEE